jgi:hypothetical protein
MSNSYSEAVTSKFIAPPAIPKTYYLVRHETQLLTYKIVLFRDLTSCSYVETLKTEAARSFEKLVLIAKYESSHPCRSYLVIDTTFEYFRVFI